MAALITTSKIRVLNMRLIVGHAAKPAFSLRLTLNPETTIFLPIALLYRYS